MKNKWTFVFFAFVVIVCSDCRTNKDTDYPEINSERYKNYISGFSSGKHQRTEPVRVEFAKQVVESGQIGQDVSNSIYKIIPEIPGKCIWKSTYLMEFYPDKSVLKGNLEYKLILNLESIFPEIDQSLKTTKIDFSYVPLEVSLSVAYPRPDPQESSQMYISGAIHVNDIIDYQKLLAAVQVKFADSKKVKFQLEAIESNPYKFELYIGPINRLEKSSELVLVWEKVPEYVGKYTETKKIRIPALDEFIVQGIDESRIGQRDLVIYFSQILDINQNIQGLITIKNDSTKLQLVKENDLIRVHLPEAWSANTGTLVISNLLKSSKNKNLEISHEYWFSLIQNPPQVRMVQQGKSLPYTRDVILPFEAINLHTVDVEIFKTFSNNVLYNIHLGFDEDFGSYNLIRLGRVIKQKVIRLSELAEGSNASAWKRYGLNLSEFIEAEPGANYQVRISFKPEYSDYQCSAGKPAIPEDFYYEETGDPTISSWWREYPYYNYSEYGNNDTEDPCNISYYYKEHFAKLSFFASNIAMIAKTSEEAGQAMVNVYDVLDGSPVKSAEVNFYDQQLQLLFSGKTDGNGMINCQLLQKPSYVQAVSGKHHSYLKISDNKSISQSEFDISGIKLQKGLKATIYAERGVWRPGDSLFINVILHLDNEKIPLNLPLEFSLINPKRQVIYKTIKSENLQGLYSFLIPTKETDLTGLYTAKIQTGLSVFEKRILIETVKPNRYKVEWQEVKSEKLIDLKNPLKLRAMWLHGAPAAAANARVSLNYKLVNPIFTKYEKYIFTDPEINKLDGELEIFNGDLNEKGEADVLFPDIVSSLRTGKLKTTLITRVTGADGDISTDYYEDEKSAHKEFVGIKIPESPYGRQVLTGVDQEIQLVVLDQKGNAIPNREIKLELFQVSYDWWFEIRSSYRGDYQQKTMQRLVQTNLLRTDQNGRAVLKINLKDYDRYFIRATNTKTQYSTGDYFYTGWTYNQNNSEFVSILSFDTDKDLYQIGEKAKLELPGASGGTYLINLIKGNKIIKTEQLKALKGKTYYEFQLTAQMVPNVYLDISFVQGRNNKVNDLPLRLYGIIPVFVEDKNSKLLPVISIKNQIKPDEKFTVEIAEEQEREMVYQLFIVDEGLLSLTRFKTPDPFKEFMSKEALSILTYDNFNEVIGSTTGELEKIFSIGGDMAIDKNQNIHNKRFQPVVLRSDPIILKKGERRKHDFTISNYIGAVRIMLIANAYGKFGSAEKTVEVKNDLMTQLSLPRTVGCTDELMVPVTIFVSNSEIKNISVQLDCKGVLKLADENKKQLSFSQSGDKTIYFKLKANGNVGNSDISVLAKSGSHTAKNTASIYVDNLNPVSYDVQEIWIEPGKSRNETIIPFGSEGTRKVRMEISQIQSISPDKLLNDLMKYPHGCLEQVVSAAFPQIVMSSLSEMNSAQVEELNKNVKLAIEKLRRFQSSAGYFNYWPGADNYSDWANSYAGHFLIEAKNSGFNVPADLLQKWYNAQRTLISSFIVDKKSNYHRPNLFQAYRLFTLSLYGFPEWAAMNVLYQDKNLDYLSKVLLSGAYSISGKSDIAAKLISGEIPDFAAYRESASSFGSDIRDDALVSLILTHQNKKTEASKLLNKLLKRITGKMHYSTQEMSFVLLSLGKLYGKSWDSKMKFNYSWNANKQSVETNFPAYAVDLLPAGKQLFEFSNLSSLPLTVRIIQSGKDNTNKRMDISHGIKMNVETQYLNYNKAVLNSGDAVNTTITVYNPGQSGRIDNLALSAVIPPGLEIENRRIGGLDLVNSKLDYVDFRDDRVFYYFGLNSGESIKVTLPLTASYPGKYNAPFFVCEAMYDPAISAKYRAAPIQVEVRK